MAVLGHKALRNVHIGHDFDARDQGGMKIFWGWRLLLQQSVDPISQLQRGLKWQHVNIAGPLAQGCGNDEVDQIDHRRFIGHDLDVVQVFALRRGRPVRMQVLDHLLDRHLAGFGDLFQQFGRFDRLFLHLQSGQQPDVIDDPLIARLRRGHEDGAAAHFQRQDAVALDELGRQRAHRLRRHRQTRRAAGPDAVAAGVAFRWIAQRVHTNTSTRSLSVAMTCLLTI